MPARLAPTFVMSEVAPKEIYNWRVYIVALVASMGAFIFGYDLAFIGTTISLPSFRKDFGLTHATQSQKDDFSANIVSLLQAGCILGSFLVAPLGDRYGRKPAMMLAGIFFCAGSLMQTLSYGLHSVVFLGRAIGGIGVGLASGLVPLYIAELSPPSIRGRLVGIYEISVQTGTCIGFWICYGVTKNMAVSRGQWMTPFAVQLIPGGLFILGLFFLPESPRWTARFQSRETALATLAKLRNLPTDHPYLQEEMTQIMNVVEEELLLHADRNMLHEIRELAAPGNRKRIIIGVLMFTFMQWAGSNAINYYSPRIFASIGINGAETGLYATGIYGIVRLVCVIITMYYLVDKVGRRKLLIIGAIVMLLPMWALGSYVKLAPQNTTAHVSQGGIAAAAFIYIYAIGYCLSYAGIPWIYCAEIFPVRIRGIGMAICTATHWILNFVIARSVPYMISNIGYGTYFVFAACLTLSVPFVYFFVPETRGISLEEMDVLFGVPGASLMSDEQKDLESTEEKAHVQHVEERQSRSPSSEHITHYTKS